MSPKQHRKQRTRISVALVAAAGAIALATGCSGGGGARAEASLPHSPLQLSQLQAQCLEILDDAVLSENAMLRANAIEGLMTTPNRALPSIRMGLRDRNPGVRFVAAMAVGQLRLKETTIDVRPLMHDPDLRVRASAMYALWQLGEQVDLTPISYWLENPNPQIRSEAARVLGELGNPSAVPMLRAAAARPTNGETESPISAERLFQLQVAEAMVKLGEMQEADAIRAALYPSGREGFEAAVLAAQILGEVHDERAIAQLVELIEQRVPGTREAANPRHDQFIQPPELRLAAARALAQMGHPGGMYVADMYSQDTSPYRRIQVAFVYGSSGLVRYLEPLEKLMADESSLVQVAAASAALKLLSAPGASYTSDASLTGQ